MGNPLNYRDGMSFAWENGRWLKTVTKNGNTINMQYDINGLRTQKGNTHYYYDTDNNLIAMVKGNDTLHFYYDSNNSPIAFTRNNTMYYYVKNIQGDIIKIVNENGGLAYTYDYDAWGALLSIKDNYGHTISGNSLATTNPLRYRGYVYDDETGLYYLQSRYYDPETGRFINPDKYFDTSNGNPLSANMYVYCENNYANKVDLEGKASTAVWLAPKECPVEKSLKKSNLFYYIKGYYRYEGKGAPYMDYQVYIYNSYRNGGQYWEYSFLVWEKSKNDIEKAIREDEAFSNSANNVVKNLNAVTDIVNYWDNYTMAIPNPIKDALTVGFGIINFATNYIEFQASKADYLRNQLSIGEKINSKYIIAMKLIMKRKSYFYDMFTHELRSYTYETIERKPYK